MQMNEVLITFDIMWKGMAGIFTVMIIVMFLVKLLKAVCSEKKTE